MTPEIRIDSYWAVLVVVLHWSDLLSLRLVLNHVVFFKCVNKQTDCSVLQFTLGKLKSPNNIQFEFVTLSIESHI